MIWTTHKSASASDGVKTGDGTGVGFFIPLDPSLAAKFPGLGAEDRSKPHVTFLQVGNVPKDQESKLVAVANTVFQGWVRGPVTGQLMDMEYFEQPAKNRRVAVMRLRFSHDMAGLRWRLRDVLQEAGFNVDDSFPLVYRPHVTLAYLDGLDATFDDPLPQGSWGFDGIEVWGMSKLHTVHFGNPTRRNASTGKNAGFCHMPAMYHGTDNPSGLLDDQTFNWSFLQSRDAGYFGSGFYLADTPNHAKSYGKVILEVGVKHNAKILCAVESGFSGMSPTRSPSYQDEFANFMVGRIAKLRGEDRAKDVVLNQYTPEGRDFDALGWRKMVTMWVKDSRFADAINWGSETIVVNPQAIEYIRKVRGKLGYRHRMAMHHEVSVGLMKFLSAVATKLGVAKDVYVVGGAVRNFVIGQPVKDIDVVIDTIALRGKDSEWFAKQLQRAIPTQTSLATNNYGVAILTISGDWEVGGQNLKGEVIEIANARTESYAPDTYKPEDVAPATIKDDVYRREFSFNTLLWRLHDLADGPDKAEILDLTGCGLKDLHEGVMRCPSDPDKTFGDDPSRMIRAVKFLLKYGFKIAPEVKASIKRNKEKVRNIPGGHLSNMLITLFYETGVGKRALVELDKLGILDVIRSIATTDKPFREALANWAERKADVAFLFDLMDLGMPVGKSLGFLNPAQKARVREITVDMTAEEGATFVAVLEQPGKVIDMPGLIQEFGLKGAQIRDLVVASRMTLLDDPVLVVSPRRWESRIRTELSKQGKTAKTFTINEGDPVFFGKYKNKRGLIKDFGVSDRGDPTVVVEPIPKGRKQDLELNLFKIREDGGQKPGGPVPGSVDDLAKQVPPGDEVTADLAGHTPEYQRLVQEYNVMNRTAKQTIDEDTDIEGWSKFRKTEPIKAVKMDEPFEVETLEGTMQGKKGDWLAEGIEGERWVIDSDIFAKTYEKMGKTAGWWPIKTEDQPGLPWGDLEGAKQTGLVNGDTPADILGNVVNILADEWWKEWERVPTATELDAAWNFVMAPIRKGTLPVETTAQYYANRPNVGDPLVKRVAHEYQIKKACRQEWEDRCMPNDGDSYAWETWGGVSYQGIVTDTDSNVLEVACTDGKTRMVEAAKFTDKKEVKKQDGGTMTVYEYSDKHIEKRNENKAEQVEKLRGSIDKLRTQYRKDLTSDDEKTRNTALAVGLMDVTFERVGNDESAKDGHFGVTGWQKKHVTLSGGKATIKYVGKSGVDHVKEVTDAAIVKALKVALKGKKDNDLVCDGEDCSVGATDVNKYLAPFDVSAKDIRGYHANSEMQDRLKAVRAKGGTLPPDPKEREKKLKDEFKQALAETAEAVGHEPSTLRSQYLVPGLEEDFMDDGKLNKSFVKKAFNIDRALLAQYIRKGHTPKALHAAGIEHFRLECHYCGGVTQCRCSSKIHPDRMSVVGVCDRCLEAKMGMSRVASVRDPLESEWGEVLATKTDGEKEDEGAERLVRPAPKIKPPRHDLHQEKVVESDPDLDAKDDDLSLNYKKVAYHIEAINKRQQKKNDKKNAPRPPKPPGTAPKPPSASESKEEPEHKSGDVWKTDAGYAAKNPDGVTHSFKDKEPAEAYAKGKPVGETLTDGKGETKSDASAKVEALAKAMETGSDADKARDALKKEHPNLAKAIDEHYAEYQKANRNLAVAYQAIDSKKKDKGESQAAFAKAEEDRNAAIAKIRALTKAPDESPSTKDDTQSHKPGDVWQNSNGRWMAMDPDGKTIGTGRNKGLAEALAKGEEYKDPEDSPDDPPSDKEVAPPTKDEDKELDDKWQGEAPKPETPAKEPEAPAEPSKPEAPVEDDVGTHPPLPKKTPAPEDAGTPPPLPTTETTKPDTPAEPKTPTAPPVDQEEAIAKKPLVIGGVAVSDNPKTQNQLVDRSKAAMHQFSGANPKERKTLINQLHYGLGKAKKGTDRYLELQAIANGMDAASIAKDGKQIEVGEGDDRQLLTDQQSPQYLALGKMLGRVGKTDLLLNINSNDPEAFYGPKGREAIMDAMSHENINDSELVAFHGIDNGMLDALNSKDVPDGTKDILRRFMKNVAIDNMTMCHSFMMASYAGTGKSPAKRQVQDALDSGSVPNAKYQYAPLTVEERKRILGKVKPEDQDAVHGYLKGRFSLGYSDYANLIMSEVEKLEKADPNANLDMGKISRMNESEAEAACEKSRLLHLKYLEEVLGRPELQRTPAIQLQEFRAHVKPETRERMKGISPAEFMEIIGALMAPESGGSTPTKKAMTEEEFFRRWSFYTWPITT